MHMEKLNLLRKKLHFCIPIIDVFQYMVTLYENKQIFLKITETYSSVEVHVLYTLFKLFFPGFFYSIYWLYSFFFSRPFPSLIVIIFFYFKLIF